MAATWTLTRMTTYPEKGAPGVDRSESTLTGAGLVGDRHKKRALLVVSEALDEPGLRSNLVLDTGDADLYAYEGCCLAIGEAVVRLTRRPVECAGLYGETVREGDLRVGDLVTLLEDGDAASA